MSEDKARITSESSQHDSHTWELYIHHLTRAWDSIEKQTESFDRNLLTLSSSGLGVSLIFIKDLIDLKKAIGRPWLYFSWGSFAACILITVFSFLLSVAAHNEHISHLQDYYFKNQKEAPNAYRRALTVCTFVAGLMFLGGVACTIIFCIRNVENIR